MLKSFRIVFAATALWSTQLQAAQVESLNDWIPALDRLAPDLHGAVGIALVRLPEYVGASDYENRVLPIVIASYKDRFYFRIKRAGVWVYQNADRSLRLGFAVEPRGGFDEEDSALLAGMSSRNTSWEGGVVLAWEAKPIGLVELSYLKDMSANSNGASASLKLSRPLYEQDRLSIVGSMSVEWLNDRTADYYFSVRPEEALPTRPAYTATDTLNLGLAVVGSYRLDDRWRVISGGSIRRLGNAVADSPIVTERLHKVGYIGIGWGF